jgi:hypothetical protein
MVQTLPEEKSHTVDPAVWLRHFQAICDAKRAHRETAEIVSAAKKAAKGAGMNMRVLKLTEDLAALDTDEATVQMRHVFQNMIWLGKPLGTQGDLFPTKMAAPEKVVAEREEWEAGDAGYDAGKTGGRRDANPFQPGSPLYDTWDRQWLKGQAIIAAEMDLEADIAADDRADKTPPAAARRGRPPKKGNGVSATAH